MSAITRFLPKNHLSFLVGKLVHLRLPKPLTIWIIRLFAKSYKINLKEAEKPINEYDSLGDFFVRRLKPNARPIGRAWALHPADAVITQAGVIFGGKLIQAKNKTYSAESFLADPKAMQRWEGGIFLTYYLCPTDYHRVHSPVDGIIKKVTAIPGALWPVNQWSTTNINELFSINERVVVEIESDRGAVAVVFVGATNVGQIELTFDSEIRGNQLLSNAVIRKTYADKKIKKGEELGQFRMGSTVVMMYDPEAVSKMAINIDEWIARSVKVNSDFC